MSLMMDLPLTGSPGIGPGVPLPIIHEEPSWLERPPASLRGLASGMSASRWRGIPEPACRATSSIDPACHVISVALRTMKLTVSASGRTVHEGWLTPGTVKVHLPGQALEATFLGPYDVLHLHMPSELLARCMATGHDEERGTWVEITDSPMASDPVVDRLVRSLIRSDGLGDVLDQLHAESIALAIVARVISNFARRAMPATAPAGAGLAKWRLRRSLDFIETHLAASIGLADMAASAGISRMHFAAQFRAAMGIRPHDYLLRRRIERAQDMLSTSRLPLAEVALEVGFKSQSHFTTVFTKLVGETPRNWRQRTRADAAATGTGSAISRMA